MITDAKPFLARTAADVMTREVVTIPADMSLQAAARRLARAQISGAPVVDAEGRCIGVLSASDFVSWAESGERTAGRDGPVTHHHCAEWEILDFDILPQETVRRYMTTDVVTAQPTTTIGALARDMLDAHIHRLIVVDNHGRPVGVVSSTDILAAMAYEATDW